MELTHITIAGTMRGSAWGCTLGDDTADMEIEFSMDFAAPHAPHSPWKKDWCGMRDALDQATSSGDLIGGQGSIINAYVVFHLVEPGKFLNVTREINPRPCLIDMWESA